MIIQIQIQILHAIYTHNFIDCRRSDAINNTKMKISHRKNATKVKHMVFIVFI